MVYRLSGNAFINGLFVLLPQQGSKKNTHQRCYAVWEGIGLMGTAFIAWIIFNEAMPPQKLFAFAIILIGLTMVKNGTARTGSE